MGFISQQPNGLYCRFCSIVDCPTHWNMTREEYLNNATGNISSRSEGEDILKRHLVPFEEVKNRFTTLNMSRQEFDELLREMGEAE